MKTISITNKMKWVLFFSIAMGFLEAAVVIYARALFFPEGFQFPMFADVPAYLGVTELIREAAALIMLIAVGMLAGKNSSQRFAYFILSFAIWDIIYYVALKAVLNWPANIFTWDLLFLLPVTWTGPVITPIIIALIMIGMALLILYFNQTHTNPRVMRKQWFLLISGAILSIMAFTWDFGIHALNAFNLWDYLSFSLNHEQLQGIIQSYKPGSFNWWLYGIGVLVLLAGTTDYYLNYQRLAQIPLGTKK